MKQTIILLFVLFLMGGHTTIAQTNEDLFRLSLYSGVDQPTLPGAKGIGPYFGYEFAFTPVPARPIIIGLKMEGRHTILREIDSVSDDVFTQKFFTYSASVGGQIPNSLSQNFDGCGAGITVGTAWRDKALDPIFPIAAGPYLRFQYNPFGSATDKNGKTKIGLAIFAEGTYLVYLYKTTYAFDNNAAHLAATQFSFGLSLTLRRG